MGVVRDPGTYQKAYGDARQALARRRDIQAVRTAVQLCWRHSEDAQKLKQLQSHDTQNSLYTYLEILHRLRNASQPLDEQTVALLRSLQGAPPVQLYLAAQHDLVARSFVEAGLPMRIALAEAPRSTDGPWREVIRETADRLIVLSNDLNDQQRIADAKRALAAVIRLGRDVMSASPSPEIALLAAEFLPTALRLADERDSADALSRFPTDFHAAADDRPVNLIPRMSSVAPAVDAQQQLLRAVLAVAVSLIAYLFCLGIAFICILMYASAPPRYARLYHWPWDQETGRVPWRLGPLILAATVLSLFIGEHIWLFSEATLPSRSAVLSIILTVATALAITITIARTCLRRQNGGPGPSGRAVAGAALAILVVTLFGTLVLGPSHDAPWSPPTLIQRLRLAWVALGVESIAVLLVLTGYGWFRHRGETWRRMQAFSGRLLELATVWLVAAGLMSVATWAWGMALDRAHADAFESATSDLIADRLGPKWQSTYFPDFGPILDRLESAR